ncbi:leucine-rich repeat flightless-interacting protein 2-like [Protopterus annectens]|uniref:leucine-rich repeat flightless-interacting protein 2-like n=1 Tax=Protopterus annectens TaxID=7888 RepID=UPI001CFA13D4|nr:leucine-rich repeat flightless-interacting protein 2-like [Protopterus annectens]
MGTPGSGRKRTPIKDRFSAEDDALNQIAREAEARLAAKRAARAEARDIRMRELERQQKELSQRSLDRKWGQIQKWMEDTEKAKHFHRSGQHSLHHKHHLVSGGDVKFAQSTSSHRSSSFNVRNSNRSRATTSRRRDLASAFMKEKTRKNPLTMGLYHDQRNYSNLVCGSSISPCTKLLSSRGCLNIKVAHTEGDYINKNTGNGFLLVCHKIFCGRKGGKNNVNVGSKIVQ